jgi:hypothetical protein
MCPQLSQCQAAFVPSLSQALDPADLAPSQSSKSPALCVLGLRCSWQAAPLAHGRAGNSLPYLADETSQLEHRTDQAEPGGWGTREGEGVPLSLNALLPLLFIYLRDR